MHIDAALLRQYALSSTNLWQSEEASCPSFFPSFVVAMGETTEAMRRDVAPAYEMLTLLAEACCDGRKLEGALDGMQKCTEGIYYRAVSRTVVLAIHVPPSSLEYIALWCAESLRSDRVKSMEGTLLIPFVIDFEASDTHRLLPEWWTLFCPNGDLARGVPLLALKSVLDDERFGDWVQVAKQRMPMFGIA